MKQAAAKMKLLDRGGAVAVMVSAICECPENIHRNWKRELWGLLTSDEQKAVREATK